jgi:O-antigen ligase
MSRNNFSSGNMITMATAGGVCFYLGISGRLARPDSWVAMAAALALALTVALHAVSRNSQLLLAVLLLAAVWHRFRSWRAAFAGGLLGLGMAAAIWNFSPTTKGRFAELATSLQNATSTSGYGNSGGIRLRMYQEAFQGMVEHPFLGAGVGSWLPHWNAAWLAMDVPVTPELKLEFSTINNPHNDFLLAGSETGVVGMAILVWLLVAGIRQGWRQRSASGGIVAVLGVSVFFTALVNAPFRDAALGMTLLWLFGASLAAQRRPGDA